LLDVREDASEHSPTVRQRRSFGIIDEASQIGLGLFERTFPLM
jgi:hypothetical protein